MPGSMWNSAGAFCRLGAGALCAALLLAAPPAWAGDEEGCLACHGLAGLAVREAGAARPLGLSGPGFNASAHGILGCRECHLDIVSIPHGERPDPGCGLPCHGQSAGGKEYSHEGLYWEYTTSSHGSSRSRKIGCLLCHPAPQPGSGSGRDKIGEARRCASCHRENERVREWFTDRHFLELAGGNRRAPSCPDCHSSHRVRPASAPESHVHPGRLAETCSNGAVGAERGGACHGDLGPTAVARASMSPLPARRTRKDPLALALTLLAGAMLAGLLLRAGIGLARGR